MLIHHITTISRRLLEGFLQSNLKSEVFQKEPRSVVPSPLQAKDLDYDGVRRIPETIAPPPIINQNSSPLSVGPLARSAGKVETVKTHHLAPCSHEVLNKFRLRVVSGVDLGDRSKLRVRSEDQIDARAGPFDVS